MVQISAEGAGRVTSAKRGTWRVLTSGDTLPSVSTSRQPWQPAARSRSTIGRTCTTTVTGMSSPAAARVVGSGAGRGVRPPKLRAVDRGVNACERGVLAPLAASTEQRRWPAIPALGGG